MHLQAARKSAFILIMSAALLSGCGKETKDDALGQIITDCQLNVHGDMETSTLPDEKKHFAIGGAVEKCLKASGLQPVEVAQGDNSCVETPSTPENGAAFIKPLQKCWKNARSSKN